MSSFELRITLLVLAVVVVLAMYIWYRSRDKELPFEDYDDPLFADDLDELTVESSRDDGEDVTPELRAEFREVSAELKQEVVERRKSSQLETKVSEPKMSPVGEPAAKLESAAEDLAASESAVDEKIVVMHVAAHRPEVFSGPMILQMMEELGLDYGEMGIFHYYAQRLSGKQSIFSVANMVKPGTFDLSEIENFTSPGLTMILQLPGPEEGLKAYNIMLESAQRLATFLKGDLLDAQRNPLSKQMISHEKEQVQLFSLRAGTTHSEF